MAKTKSMKLIVAAVALLLVAALTPVRVSAAGEAIAICLELNGFNSTNTSGASGNTLIRVDGSATTYNNALRLTQPNYSQAGTAVRRNQIKLENGFSTYFQFKLSEGSNPPADGLAFIVYKSDTPQIGEYGGGLGYMGIGNSIIVEFDTYQNTEYGDPSSPSKYHFAIMKNGNPSHSGQPYQTYASIYGSTIHVWVDYNGATGNLTVVCGTSSTRSGNSNTLTRNVGTELVGQNVFVGFSASTGGSYEYHDVYKWYFKNSYVSGGLSSSAGSYTQGASTVGITVDSTSTPTYANIVLRDATGAAISGAADIYIDDALKASGVSVGASGYQYSLSGIPKGSHIIRAVASGGASNYLSFTLPAAAPNIASHPASQTVSVGSPASFSVSASSPDGGALSYQWQANGGGGWGNIGGANGASYGIGSATINDNGKRFRCLITNTVNGQTASAYTNEATLTVNRLPGSISITGDPSKVYDGAAATNPAVTKSGTGAVSYAYYTDSAGSPGAQISAPSNAGVYWVRATLAQTDTYTQASDQKKFTIAKLPIASGAQAAALLSYGNAPRVYNGSPQALAVSPASGVTGLGAITVYYEGDAGTTYPKSTTPPTDAGAYKVSASIAEGMNYGAYSDLALCVMSVGKANFTGVGVAAFNGTYDGNPHGVAITGAPSGTTVTYSVTDPLANDLAEAPSFTAAGTYTVYYRLHNPNYNDLTGSATVVIAKKSLSAAMIGSISDVVYDGSTHAPLPSITDGTPSILAPSDYTVSYQNNRNAGTATFTVTATAGGNYQGSASRSFTIKKKALTDGMIAAIAEATYNGAAHAPALTVADGNPSVITASDYTVSYTNNVNAGAATATITATPGGNYEGSASRAFTIGKKALAASMVAAIPDLTYTGAALTPALSVTDGSPSAIKPPDYTVSYADNVDAGTATVTIAATGNGNYRGAVDVHFTIGKKALDATMIAEIAAVVYNGAAHTPAVAVTDGNPSAIKASDYTVSYQNNRNAGTAAVTITAAEGGNYKGSASRAFTIEKKALSNDMIAALPDTTYNGAAHTPALTVTDGAPGIIATSDYTVSYTGNVNAGTATATITATAGGNYKGFASAQFVIHKKMLSGLMIADIPGLTYTGAALEPLPFVTDGIPNAIQASDYTVSYTNNVNAGIAHVMISATAGGNYAGFGLKSFMIQKKALDATMIAGIAAVTYDGSAHTPTISVTDGSPGTIKASDYTVSYQNNVNAGTATVTVAAAEGGNYKGSASRAFTINKKALSDGMIAAIAAVTYNGAAQTPALTVTDGTPSIIAASDYTVSYTNNVHAGAATATIAATLNGNYSGAASRTFTVNKKPLDAAMIAAIASRTYDGTAYEPALTVADGAPSIITAADYTVSYSTNVNAGTATATITATEGGNYAGSASRAYTIDKKALTADMVAEIVPLTYTGSPLAPPPVVTDGSPSIIKPSDYAVSYANNVNAGTATVTVAATAAGNYEGVVSKTFAIGKKPLTEAMIVFIASAAYTGAPQYPMVIVADGGPSAIRATDYAVSYSNNVSAGYGTVTVTASAAGNYSGSASKVFAIEKAKLATAAVAPVPSVTYDGRAHTPIPAVTAGGVPISAAEYTVSYLNNTNAGTASILIAAVSQGNYEGTITVTFKINRRQLSDGMISSISDWTYTGSAIEPSFTVKDGSLGTVGASQYTVSYVDNTNAGTARVVITARQGGNYAGFATRSFSILPATVSGTASIPAEAKVGDTLEADLSGVTPKAAAGSLAYQWTRDGAAIAGATSASYTATDADAGKTLSVVVTANGNYAGSFTSGGAAIAKNAQPDPGGGSPVTLDAPQFGANGGVSIGGSVNLGEGAYQAEISFRTPGGEWQSVPGAFDGNSFNASLEGLAPGKTYEYRVTVTANGETHVTTGRFRVPEAGGAAAGSISGTVADDTGLGRGITVTIEAGNTIVASVTGLQNGGSFEFVSVPDGVYNLVADNGGYRVTRIVTVQNGEAVGNITMTLGKKQSVVEIRSAATPDIAAGGLNELFGEEGVYTAADAEVVAAGGTVEIRLVAEIQQKEMLDADEAEKIADIAGGRRIGMYLELTLVKTVYDGAGNELSKTELTDVQSLVEIAIPIPDEMKGSEIIAVYRAHGGVVEALPIGAANANANGEYCEIGEGYVTLHVNRFSTYALATSGRTAAGACSVHWWLLAVLILILVAGTLVARRNMRRIEEAKGGAGNGRVLD